MKRVRTQRPCDASVLYVSHLFVSSSHLTLQFYFCSEIATYVCSRDRFAGLCEIEVKCEEFVLLCGFGAAWLREKNRRSVYPIFVYANSLFTQLFLQFMLSVQVPTK
jgi:hypothetical protein